MYCHYLEFAVCSYIADSQHQQGNSDTAPLDRLQIAEIFCIHYDFFLLYTI